MNIFGRNASIKINGNTYAGNNITVNGNQVIVDGVVQGDTDGKQKIEVTILSGVESIHSEESIYINGDVTGNVQARTSVNCNDITGDVKAGTSVNCDDIKGDASAGTSINCDDIGGNANARVIYK